MTTMETMLTASKEPGWLGNAELLLSKPCPMPCPPRLPFQPPAAINQLPAADDSDWQYLDWLMDLLFLCRNINGWLDTHLVAGNRENIRIAARAFRLLNSQGYRFDLLQPLENTGLSTVRSTYVRLWKVLQARKSATETKGLADAGKDR